MPDKPVRILFVCLGNICRSPTAEAVLRQKVKALGLERQIFIDSAGTAAYHIGKQPDQRTQHAGQLRGVDMHGLKARQVKADDFLDFDYVLAMDYENLTNLRSIQPSNGRARLELFLREYGDADYDEVPDPYYGGTDGFELVLDLLDDACEHFLVHLKRQFTRENR